MVDAHAQGYAAVGHHLEQMHGRKGYTRIMLAAEHSQRSNLSNPVPGDIQQRSQTMRAVHPQESLAAPGQVSIVAKPQPLAVVDILALAVIQIAKAPLIMYAFEQFDPSK